MKKRIPKTRPIRENLLRQLALAKEHLGKLYAVEKEFGGLCECKEVIRRAEEDVEKLTRLTS